MSIKRYIADADNTITNAYEANLTTRGTGSSMGQSDVLEVFSIYGQVSSSAPTGYSQELSRILIKFPVDTMSSDRTAGTIPVSGSVSWYLRMYNARHAFTTPKDLILTISPLTTEWQEGNGLDMEGYTDLTYDGAGSNWLRARSGSAGLTSWNTIGGDYSANKSPATNYDVTFPDGTGDLEVDISELVEQWIAGTIDNYGVMVKLTGSQEAYTDTSSATAIINNTTGSKESYYTKKFFARGSEYFFKRPCIEARFDESNKDDRGNFYYSSSLSDGDGNVNTLYLYNYVRGRLANIPGIATDYTGEIYVSFFSGSSDNTKVADRQEPIKVTSLNTVATASLYIAGNLTNGNHFELTDTAGNTGKFIVSTTSSTVDGTKDSQGFIIIGVSNNSNVETTTDRFVSTFNAQTDVAITAAEDSSSATMINLSQDTYGINGNTTADFSSVDQIQCVSDAQNVFAGGWGSQNSYVVTGGYVETGIYSASVCLTSAATPLTRLYDVWFTGSHVISSSVDPAATVYRTGSFSPNSILDSLIYETPRYTTKITNLKAVYRQTDKPRLRTFVKELGADYNIYTKATAQIPSYTIEDAYYKVIRVVDDLEAVSYGTGSAPATARSKSDYTRLSFDVSGGYFDFDMSLLEKGYAYGFKLAYYTGAEYLEQPETFKFRIEDKT